MSRIQTVPQNRSDRDSPGSDTLARSEEVNPAQAVCSAAFSFSSISGSQ